MPDRPALRRYGFLSPAFAVLAVLVLWKGYVAVSDVSPFVLPPPEQMILATAHLLSATSTWRHVATTALECLGGFVLASAFGISFGIALAKNDALSRALHPPVVALQVLPKVALVPLLILWFGFGLEAKVVISAVMSVFPILVATERGFRSIDRGHVHVMKVLRANRMQTVLFLEFPTAMPLILTGLEIGIVLAFNGAIVGEFLSGREGLGYLVVVTLQELQIDRLFGVVLIQTVLGFSFYAAIATLRRHLVPWQSTPSEIA